MKDLDWIQLTEKESRAVKNNLEEILETIQRLDGEFPAVMAERERRSVGDLKLLDLLDDFDEFQKGNVV